jgi:DNA-binding transcriptional LysR family regulator
MASSLTEMAVFQRVAERGSFAGAAEDAGLSPSAVAKLVTRLEERLGVRLINRTTRRLALTAEGAIYLDRVREILGAVDAAESEVTSARGSPRGHLRVHTFPVIAANQLAPALPDFLARHPHITFDFMVTNRIVDLVGENVDVSLRMGPLEDSGLVSRKIVDLTRVVCASPSYLARQSPILKADKAGVRIDQLLARSIEERDGFRRECIDREPSGRNDLLDAELLRTDLSTARRDKCRQAHDQSGGFAAPHHGVFQ